MFERDVSCHSMRGVAGTGFLWSALIHTNHRLEHVFFIEDQMLSNSKSVCEQIPTLRSLGSFSKCGELMLSEFYPKNSLYLF